VKDTARVLGRMYDGIEFRGFAHHDVEMLAEFSACRSGTADGYVASDATYLADMLTIGPPPRSPSNKVPSPTSATHEIIRDSLSAWGALLGLDVRISAPAALQPTDEVQRIAKTVSAHSQAKF